MAKEFVINCLYPCFIIIPASLVQIRPSTLITEADLRFILQSETIKENPSLHETLLSVQNFIQTLK